MISFGIAWYQCLPGVTQFKDIPKINEFIKQKQTTNNLSHKIQILLSHIPDGIIDNDYQVIHKEYNEKLNIEQVVQSWSHKIKQVTIS